MMAQYGQSMFAVLAWTQSIALMLLTPAMVAGVIAEERQRKTLDYLLTSCLTRPEIVLGKLFARLTLVGVFLAIGLPIMAMNSFFGGVDPDIILLFFLASLSSTFFLGSLAMTVSASVQRPRDAISLTYVLEITWLFLPVVALSVMIGRGSGGIFWDVSRKLTEVFGAISPIYMFIEATQLSSASIMTNLLVMIGGQSACSAVLLWIAAIRIRPASKREGSSRGLWKGLKTKRSLQLFPRPECFDDAMLWKELFCARKSLGYQVIIIAFAAIVGGLTIYGLSDTFESAFEEFLSYGYSQSPGYSARDQLCQGLRVVMAIGYVAMAMMAASSAANSFAGERERDTWVSLIASPLTAAEMIRAKAWASVFGLKWLLAFLYGMAFLGLMIGAVHPLGLVLHLLVTSIFLGFAIALGLYFSLRSRTSTRASGFTIGILLALNIAPLMLAALGVIDEDFILPAFSPFLEFGTLFPLHRFDQPFHQDLNIIIICATFFTGAYLMTTLAIFGFCVYRFDAWNDRPRTRLD